MSFVCVLPLCAFDLLEVVFVLCDCSFVLSVCVCVCLCVCRCVCVCVSMCVNVYVSASVCA